MAVFVFYTVSLVDNWGTHDPFRWAKAEECRAVNEADRKKFTINERLSRTTTSNCKCAILKLTDCMYMHLPIR